MPRQTTRPTAERLRQLLAEHGSVVQAAKAAGVHRVTFHGWMRDAGVRVEREPVVAPEGSGAAAAE